MTFWILAKSGRHIPTSSVIPIPTHEETTESVQRLQTNFTTNAESTIGNYHSHLVDSKCPIFQYDPYNDALGGSSKLSDEDYVSPVADVFCNHDYTSIPMETPSKDKAMEELDEYIGARIPYVRDDEPMIIKVHLRYRDAMEIL